MRFTDLISKLMVVGILSVLVACQAESNPEPSEPPVRGLKTFEIKDVEETTVRRFPSVLQPSAISTLSFEVSGRLKEVALDVGQQVKQGEVLAELDPRSLELQVESAQAAVDQAASNAKNAEEDFKRKDDLLKKGVTTKAAADQARTAAETSRAQLIQAQRSLDTARENLTKATLRAPFDGILNSVDVESFTNVAAGAPVATLYQADGFETSFSVSFDVVNRLAVGKKAEVRLADNPSVVLQGHLKEVGARADTVSSFPVVVAVDETNPSIKAGMAVEISMEFTVPKGKGFAVPISVLPFEGQIDPPRNPSDPGNTEVFVYDPESGTVKKRKITVAGVRENSLIVIEGLELGDQVAAAGVSFLQDGQKVKLLSTDQ